MKYGQGLPLVIDSTDTGYVQLTFKANTKKIYKDTSNDKNCIFDIKNGDFLTSTSEYVYGYKGDVDPDTTTDSAIQLKDIHIIQNKLIFFILFLKESIILFLLNRLKVNLLLDLDI